MYRSPTNEFVASFIGSPSINTFTATIDGTTLEGSAGFEYELTDSSPVGGRDEIRVGIPPEDMTLESDGSMPSEVTVVKEMGNENFIYAEMGSVDLTARIESQMNPEVVMAVDFGFDEDDLCLFDPITTESFKTKTNELGLDYNQNVEADDCGCYSDSTAGVVV